MDSALLLEQATAAEVGGDLVGQTTVGPHVVVLVPPVIQGLLSRPRDR